MKRLKWPWVLAALFIAMCCGLGLCAGFKQDCVIRGGHMEQARCVIP